MRTEAKDSLDYFPTPPFATRALCEHVLKPWERGDKSVWEPAVGEGHMAAVLMEYFGDVRGSDVHDYGRGYQVGSFVGAGADCIRVASPYDWIITNPPFNLAIDFAERALEEAGEGVALLLRSVWIESADRYHRLFKDRPPTHIAQFAERVAMVKGRWDPEASTATSYAWFVWRKLIVDSVGTRFQIIPPGQRVALERPDDRRRFAAAKQDAPLFNEKADAA
jgi:hypothetical protein